MEKQFYIFWFNPETSETGYRSFEFIKDLKNQIFHFLYSGIRIVGIVYGEQVKYDVILTNVNDIILTGKGV